MAKILVTGATGFTGSFVVRELHKAGHNICCLVRESSDISVLDGYKFDIKRGDLDNSHLIVKALTGMDALVNVASIGFGHGPSIIEACEKAGVKRAIFFSTTAIFTTLNAQSKKIRLEAEKSIKESGLDYTIFRPTMIYGTPRDRNMIKLIRYIDRFRFVPVFGPGNSLQQPVYVNDLAMSVAKVIDSKSTFRKEYNLSGKEPLTYNEVIDTIAWLMEKKIIKIHLSVFASITFIKSLRMIPMIPKLSVEQILRLNEDKSFSHQEAANDFGYSPVSFHKGISEEVKEYYKNCSNRWKI